jgi:hypothetical protein
MSALSDQVLLVNDTLNLLRGKLVRFILEDGDMRMIANLVAVVDEMGLEYDQESMTYRDRKAELEPRLNALFSKEYSQHSDPDYDDEAPEPEPEEELDDELQEAFEHAWDAEQEAERKEAERQERNRKAREYYHANKKKGKAHGNATRKTKGR